ncbi:glycosyltransferase [Pseudoxanthomonas broegbernensis]|nr:glycosyltransferase [Pseudoxanthomonas broegbernensis]
MPSLRGGGTERAMLTLANGFAARGVRTDLVLALAEGPYLIDVAPAVRVVDLDSRRVSTSLPGLARYLRREQPRAMLSALSHANVIAAVAKGLSRGSTRLVVSERTHVSQNLHRSGSLRDRAMLPVMRFAYRNADAIVAVSHGVADDLRNAISVPKERIHVIYNPVVTPGLEGLASAPIDHPWLRGGEPPVVLAAGRLTPAKDYPTLLRAFAKVRRQRDCRLVILGEGELRHSLEMLIGDLGLGSCVQLPGFADNPFAWMRHAALFVLSSAWEGLPNVLIQAMACGTPVISTDCPSGPREILEDGKWGTLVPVADADALSEAIIERLGETGPNDPRVRASYFGVDRSLDSYLGLLLG